MATMGVRYAQGVGSDASTKLAQTLADALFGNADELRQDALARSRIATDEYSQRQIESATQWNTIRAQRDAAELAAQQGAAPVYARVMQQFNERAIPQAPLGTPNVQYSPEQNWPAPVQVGVTDTGPVPTARPLIEAESMPAPVEVPAMEPDYSFSTYPQKSTLPPAPVTGEPNLDAALMRRQPPITTGFLSPYGPEAATELSGLPEELQPVAVAEPLADNYRLTNTLVPGRPTVETREFQGPPVPVEVDPAGPPTATGDFLPEGTPVPPPQQLPGSPIMAEVQGPPIPVPVGQVQNNPDGTKTIGTANQGNITLTPEEYAAFGAQIAFSTDPQKQMSGITGNLDIMDRGPTMEGVTLRDGIPSRESVLGTDEAIKVNNAKAVADANAAMVADPGKGILVIDKIPYRPSKGANGEDIMTRIPIDTDQNGPVYLEGDSLPIQNRKTMDMIDRAVEQGLPITRQMAERYDKAVADEYGSKYETRAGQDGETIQVLIDPARPLQLRNPVDIYRRAGITVAPRPDAPASAAAAAPGQPTTAVSPAPALPPAAAATPAPATVPATAGPPGTVPPAPVVAAPAAPAVVDEFVPPVAPAPAAGGPAAPPPDAVNPDLAVPAAIPEGFDAEFVTDASGLPRARVVRPGKGPKMTEMQTKSTMFYIVGNKADGEIDKYGPDNMPPHWARLEVTTPGAQDFKSRVLAKMAANPETQKYWINGMNFANAIMRSESGAATRPEELAIVFERFIPNSNDTVETLALKTQYRAAVLDGLRLGALGDKPMASELEAYAISKVGPPPEASGGDILDYSKKTPEELRAIAKGK